MAYLKSQTHFEEKKGLVSEQQNKTYFENQTCFY